MEKIQLAWEIAETASMLRNFYDRMIAPYGVTRAQWRVLAILKREESCKQVELAARLDIEPITLSRHIDRLEMMGLVERLKDPADRRVFRLSLTQKAAPLIATLTSVAADLAEQAFSKLDDRQVRDMRANLAAIRSDLYMDDQTMKSENA